MPELSKVLSTLNGKMTKDQMGQIKDALLLTLFEQPDCLFFNKIGSDFWEIRLKVPGQDSSKPFLFYSSKKQFWPSSNFTNLPAEYLQECEQAIRHNPEWCKKLEIELTGEQQIQFTQEDFLQVIKKGFLLSKINGATSSRKVNEIHGQIANYLAGLNSQAKIFAAGFTPYYNKSGSELTVQGYPRTKRIDIGIKQSDELVGAISVKFPCSNYEQNSYNYFDSLVGEAKRLKDYDPSRLIGHALIVRSQTPYFDKQGTVSKIEEISHDSLQDYELLTKPSPYNPQSLPALDVLALVVVELQTVNGLIPEMDEQFVQQLAQLNQGLITEDTVLDLITVKLVSKTNPGDGKVFYDLMTFCNAVNSFNQTLLKRVA